VSAVLATTQLWWYTARASGLVAWALLTASVLWGLALSTKVLGKRPRPNWLLDLHRFLGGLAVVFTGAHLGSLVLDSYLHFGPAELLVPFASDYRPGAVAWGVVALYLLAAVELTSLLRRRLAKITWRAVHYLSFPLFVMATAHGITAGTDNHAFLVRAVALAATIGVAAGTALRVAQADEEAQRRAAFAPPPTGQAPPLQPPAPAPLPPSPAAAAEDARRRAWVRYQDAAVSTTSSAARMAARPSMADVSPGARSPGSGTPSASSSA
jgi:DMSO/TMAO reductase YedYZ heme-binding membrane subunit